MHGVFIAKGENVKENMWLRRVDAYDVVPTISAYMGLALPHDTDGKPLSIFTNPHRYKIRKLYNKFQGFKEDFNNKAKLLIGDRPQSSMGNVGDEAILAVIIRELKSRGFKPLVLSANPQRTMKLHSVSSRPDKSSSFRFWKALLKSSLLVFARGGKYGEKTMRRLCLLTILAKILGKRVEFRAIGVYPYE